jgi:indoleamine 2,3-dioxygenase
MLSKILQRSQKTLTASRRAFSTSDHFGWQGAEGQKNIATIFDDVAEHGFLPNSKPMIELPSEFNIVNKILDEMPHLINGEPTGLIAKNEMRKTVDSSLPNLMD